MVAVVAVNVNAQFGCGASGTFSKFNSESGTLGNISWTSTGTYAMQSFGCSGEDPNVWGSGTGGTTFTITYTPAIDYPQIRLWGLNTDDNYSIQVNGTDFSLSNTTASLSINTVCNGTFGSAGGMSFSAGNLVGSASPAAGNYAYQDLTLNATGITSVKLIYNAGTGSGIIGTSFCISSLPVKIISFTGLAGSNCTAKLDWQTGTEENVKNIELIRSENGINFTSVATIAPKGSNSNYSIQVENTSNAYFKLRTNDNDGNEAYSSAIMVIANCNAKIKSILPNPAQSQITIVGWQTGDKVKIINNLGEEVITINDMQRGTLNVAQLHSGIYIVKIYSKDGTILNLKMLKQ